MGAAFDLTPYGTEALGVMRIEKGHPAGNELNGWTTAADLGLARMASRKKDYIGRLMAERPALVDPARPRLVGLRPADGASVIRAGGHLLRPGAAPVAKNAQGYVTSACYSPTLRHPIALALLAHGVDRHGDMVVVHDPVRGADVHAQVCDPVFYDPAGNGCVADIAIGEATDFGLASVLPAAGAYGPVASTTDTIAWWAVAPGQWLAYTDHAAPDWAEALGERLAGKAAVVDQSSAYALWHITGADAQRVLQKGLPLDLAGLAPGAVAVSTIAHIGVIVYRLAPDSFHLAVFRSFAGSLREWLSATIAGL